MATRSRTLTSIARRPSRVTPSTIPQPGPQGPPAPLTAFGQNLSLPSANLQDSLLGPVNQANEARYGQGLGVLTGGHQQASGSIQKAIDVSQGFGQGARRRVGEKAKSERGRTEQDLISRGLGNATVRETMLAGVGRREEDALQDIDEQASNRQAQLLLQMANQANLGSGRIADFIGSRQDVGPDLGLMAQLEQGAAAAAPRTITSTAGSITAANAPINFGTSFSNTPGAGGSSAPVAPTQTYFGPGTGQLSLPPSTSQLPPYTRTRLPTGTSTIGRMIR